MASIIVKISEPYTSYSARFGDRTFVKVLWSNPEWEEEDVDPEREDVVAFLASSIFKKPAPVPAPVAKTPAKRPAAVVMNADQLPPAEKKAKTQKATEQPPVPVSNNNTTTTASPMVPLALEPPTNSAQNFAQNSPKAIAKPVPINIVINTTKTKPSTNIFDKIGTAPPSTTTVTNHSNGFQHQTQPSLHAQIPTPQAVAHVEHNTHYDVQEKPLAQTVDGTLLYNAAAVNDDMTGVDYLTKSEDDVTGVPLPDPLDVDLPPWITSDAVQQPPQEEYVKQEDRLPVVFPYSEPDVVNQQHYKMALPGDASRISKTEIAEFSEFEKSFHDPYGKLKETAAQQKRDQEAAKVAAEAAARQIAANSFKPAVATHENNPDMKKILENQEMIKSRFTQIVKELGDINTYMASSKKTFDAAKSEFDQKQHDVKEVLDKILTLARDAKEGSRVRAEIAKLDFDPQEFVASFAKMSDSFNKDREKHSRSEERLKFQLATLRTTLNISPPAEDTPTGNNNARISPVAESILQVYDPAVRQLLNDALLPEYANAFPRLAENLRKVVTTYKDERAYLLKRIEILEQTQTQSVANLFGNAEGRTALVAALDPVFDMLSESMSAMLTKTLARLKEGTEEKPASYINNVQRIVVGTHKATEAELSKANMDLSLPAGALQQQQQAMSSSTAVLAAAAANIRTNPYEETFKKVIQDTNNLLNNVKNLC